MKYAYEDLSDRQFEILITLICQKLFGISVQDFSEGPDGGRDAIFTGIAEIFPSKNSPWQGITIIQAKHTSGFNKSFSEFDFFSTNSDNTIIGKEIPRIKNLKKNGDLDNYILFSNRKLASGANNKIKNDISNKCGIELNSIYLFGVEQLELYLKQFKDIPDMANLDPIDSPLIVSSDELSNIIQAFADQKEDIKDIITTPPTNRISYEEKNRINNMDGVYAKNFRRRYLKETQPITNFLSDPKNQEITDMYETVVDEFNFRIISKRKDYQYFNEVLEYLLDLLFNRDAILRQYKNKRLTRAMIFYMYWNCDIGEEEDA